MAVRRPRRIFRASAQHRARRSARLLGWLLGGGTVALGGAVAALALSSGLAPNHPSAAAIPQVPAAVVTADAPAVVVVDGETLRLQDTVVRLKGVAAPARGASCRGPGGGAFDCGAAATQALAGIVRDRPVACRLQGHDALGLAQGACEASGTDVNVAIVAAGWARAEPGAGRLAVAEEAARQARRGAWSEPASGL